MSLAIQNQADKRDKDGDDKIYQLPEPILHHIRSLLSQKDAVRTCVLSKSWRYLWCARPIINFRESCTGHLSLPGRCYCKTCFRGNKEAFLFALDNTLQRYHDQKVSVHELRLEMSGNDPQSNSLVEKWIPKVTMPHKDLKTFHLLLSCSGSEYFDLPSVLFKAESLQILYLKGCNLSQIDSTDEVLLKRLQTLTLNDVHITKETLETILSRSPLLENVSLFGCEGFKNIKVCKPHGLKDIAINDRSSSQQRQFKDSVSIVIDIPTIERIRVIDCWFHHHKYLPHLTSLFLNQAGLSSKSIDFLSGKYLPCLERLILESCYLPQEFTLRHIYFINIMKYIKASIDAPNIVMFVYEPVLEVEQFSLVGDYSYASLPVFLEYLFRIFRLRCIEQRLYFGDDETDRCRAGITKLTEVMMEMFLIMEKDMKQYFWPRGLEEVTMVEDFDEHAQSFDGMKACFQLEWGELSYIS